MVLGVHLKNVNGSWELADGSLFHSESELTNSLDSMKNSTLKVEDGPIASRVSREKQVKLNGMKYFIFIERFNMQIYSIYDVTWYGMM